MSSTIEVVRFTVAQDQRTAFLADRPAAIAALRATFGGLADATLAELEDGTWIDVLRWDSAEQAKHAAAEMATVPEAARWVGHIAEVHEMAHGSIVG